MTYKILLVGDICIDIYQYGTVDRISPEAPVPVFKFSYEEQKPGMAGNVKANLQALGLEVQAISGGSITTKTRLIDLRSKQQIVRIDNDEIAPISVPAGIIAEMSTDIDAVVFSDYNKGLISYETVEEFRKLYNGPIFIDTKKHDLARFEGCIVKINSNEYASAKSLPTELIVTMGDQGALYKNILYSTPKVEVVDVCGAGDTFLSALVYKYLETRDMESSIDFANVASSISVQHTGVYTLTEDDIKSIKI